jgi:hypothetical protein
MLLLERSLPLSHDLPSLSVCPFMLRLSQVPNESRSGGAWRLLERSLPLSHDLPSLSVCPFMLRLSQVPNESRSGGAWRLPVASDEQGPDHVFAILVRVFFV